MDADDFPALDLSGLPAMILDRVALARMPRGTEIFVYQGYLEDPTTLTAVERGILLGYDTATTEVHYRTISEQTGTAYAWRGTDRAMLTDRSSGLVLPDGSREPEQPLEKRVRLDEDHIILDGKAYVLYTSDHENWRSPNNPE